MVEHVEETVETSWRGAFVIPGCYDSMKSNACRNPPRIFDSNNSR